MIAQRLDAPICPECGQPAEQTATRYGVRHDCCGLHSWGGKPLATPATHAARRAAHAAFDPLWQEGRMSRKEAYRELARALGLSRRECHISLMDERTAKRVPAAVAAMADGLEVTR